MSYSLKIDSGDLVIGKGRALETVSGADKLGQDLRLWVLERIGTDAASPALGSRLDGGFVNGVEIESFIGQINTEERVNEVRADLNNLLAQYQTLQLAKMKREVILYNGNHTLSPDEILQTIVSIETKGIVDTIVARITIQTMAGTQVRLTVPVAL